MYKLLYDFLENPNREYCILVEDIGLINSLINLKIIEIRLKIFILNEEYLIENLFESYLKGYYVY